MPTSSLVQTIAMELTLGSQHWKPEVVWTGLCILLHITHCMLHGATEIRDKAHPRCRMSSWGVTDGKCS